MLVSMEATLIIAMKKIRPKPNASVMVSFLITVTTGNLKRGRFIGTHDLRRHSPSWQGGHGSRGRIE